MPRSIKNLKADDVQRNLNILKQVLHEADPAITVGSGPVHDLVLYYAAAFTAANQRDIAEAMAAINLGRLAKNPNGAAPEHVDRVLANWLVRRQRGTPSKGVLTLLTSQQTGFVIPPGTTFQANGHTFKTTGTLQIRAHAKTLTDSDRLLVKQARGQWSCNVPVISVTQGNTSNIRRGTQVKFDKEYLPHVHRAYANKDFTGGADEETNDQMLNRLVRTAGGKVWSNRFTGEALVCKHPKFDRAIAVSIIGFGDPEMTRDQHTLWPGSTGGRSDVYVKPNGNILTKEVKVLGTAIEERADGVVWELYIERTAAPGFFYAASVTNEAGVKCSILQDTRLIDTEGAETLPDLQNGSEAAYSAYQAAKLLILEPRRGQVNGLADFLVDLRYLDGIDELQEQMHRRDVTSATSDILVKAAVPCFTAVEIEVQRKPHDPQVNADVIKEAVATAINHTGFTGHLSVTSLLGIISTHLAHGLVMRDIKLSGKIRYPDGRIETLPSGSLLTIPNEPTRLVSPRTTTFFQDPADVTVVVTTTTGLVNG
jgi:hypothetical protein